MTTRGGVASDRDCRTLASSSIRFSVLPASVRDYSVDGVEDKKMSELKIGDKIKVIIPSSVFYGEVVELVEITETRYYFTNENHQRGTFSILKNEQSGFERLECEE